MSSSPTGSGASSLDLTARPAWREIDEQALRLNVRALRARSRGARTLAVVKADAYGHDAVAVSRVLEEEGVFGLVVSSSEEGERLRKNGARSRVLVLGGGVLPSPEAFDRHAKGALTPVLSSLEQVRAAVASPALRGGVHLLVDTGMARLGIALEEVGKAIELLGTRRSEVGVEGLATHFSESEVASSAVTRLQLERFSAAAEQVLSVAPEALLHVANSAASLHLLAEGATWRGAVAGPVARALSDPKRLLIRPGGALYGVDLSTYEQRAADRDLVNGGRRVSARRQNARIQGAPKHERDGTQGRDLDLVRPVLSVRARLVQVRHIGRGDAVGYGSRWCAPRATRIGVLPLGYADGIPSRSEGKAEVVAGGQRVPLVGAVSMDLLTVDVTDCNCEVGDVVEVLGGSDRAAVTLGDWVHWSGQKPYEVLCGFSRRLPLREASD